jgi:glyoxylase-like metal-dependent hydrolase (beta-lactamase superfamily II)
VRVADGIDTVEGLRVGNAYLVQCGTGLLLVDSGTPGSAMRVLESVRRIGGEPRDLRHIVLTHWHIDHVGGAAELQRRTGAKVAIHCLDAPVLAGRERPRKGRLAMSAIERLLRLERAVPDLLLDDDGDIAGLEVIHVPGHTAGSIALRRADGVLFSGDALLADRHGEERDPDPSLALDPDLASASAARLRMVPRTVLLAGHGAPAFSRTRPVSSEPRAGGDPGSAEPGTSR